MGGYEIECELLVWWMRSWALSWLRRDFELCSALYDVNTDIAAARLEHRDVSMLKNIGRS